MNLQYKHANKYYNTIQLNLTRQCYCAVFTTVRCHCHFATRELIGASN